MIKLKCWKFSNWAATLFSPASPGFNPDWRLALQARLIRAEMLLVFSFSACSRRVRASFKRPCCCKATPQASSESEYHSARRRS